MFKKYFEPEKEFNENVNFWLNNFLDGDKRFSRSVFKSKIHFTNMPKLNWKFDSEPDKDDSYNGE